MLRHAAPMILALALASCTDSVTMVSPDQISGFKPGTTNQTEVAAALGKPYHTIIEADGTKIDQYPYEGGSTSQSYRMISFAYGAGGVLKEIKGDK